MTLWVSYKKFTLWASCIILLAQCGTPAYAEFKPLTRSEPVVRMVLQESNNEPFYGMVAVAGTAFDRRSDDRWPNTVKDVVYQPWQYEGMSIKLKNYSISDIELARTARRVASEGVRPCGKVTHFHATYIERPTTWPKKYKLVCQIGNHKFYGD